VAAPAAPGNARNRQRFAALRAAPAGAPRTAPILLFSPLMPAHAKKLRVPADRIPADLEEIHHLLDGFADELRKLDEALETLAAYLVRLQCKSLPADRTLH
jgi:hypothetical protein